MKIKADLHNHLAEDNLGNFDKIKFCNRTIEIAEQRLRKGGILGLVNCLGYRYEKFAEKVGYYKIDLENALYFPGKDILIPKAQEVFAKEGDILVLGLPKGYYIGKEGDVRVRSIEDCLKEAKDMNGIIGMDHGFHMWGAGHYLEKHPKLLEYFDFFEVHNGNAWFPHPKYLNASRKAQEFYKEVIKDFPHLGVLCSSDGHSLYEIGSSYSLLDEVDHNSAEKLTESLRESIRAHKGWSDDKRENSYLGASAHAIELILPTIIEKVTGIYPSPKK